MYRRGQADESSTAAPHSISNRTAPDQRPGQPAADRGPQHSPQCERSSCQRQPPAPGVVTCLHRGIVPALGHVHRATAPGLRGVGARRHGRRLDPGLLGGRGKQAGRVLHRAGDFPQPAGLRAAVAVEHPGQLPHRARHPRRAGQGGQREERQDHPLHDRRPAVAQRTGHRDARLGRVLGLQGPAGRPDHAPRLRHVQLRPVPRGDGPLPGLAGFWIDNDNEYWEQNHLYEQIRESGRPGC